MPEVASIYSKLVLQAGQFHAELDRAAKGLERFAEQAAHLTTGLAGVGGLAGVLTGGGVIAGLGAFIEHGQESIRTQVEFAKVLGESAGGLSQLQHAAVMSNVSIEDFQHGMTRLQRSLGGAESAVTHNAVSFEKWGLNAHELAALPLADAFEKIAGRFTEIQSSSERSALAFSLFGRQGQKLIPLLAQGKEGIAALRQEADRLGITLGEKTIAEFEAAERAAKQLKEASDALSRSWAEMAGPVIARFDSGLTRIIRSMSNATAFLKQGDVLNAALKLGTLDASPLGGAGKEAGGSKRAADENLSRMRELERALTDAYEKQVDVASGIDEWTKKFDEAYEAAWKLAREMDKMKPGSGDSLVAQAEKLKEAMESGKKAAKEARDLANDTKVDDERRNARKAKEAAEQEANVKEIERLQDAAGGGIGQFKEGFARLKGLREQGLSKEAYNQGIVELLQKLPAELQKAPMAGATMRGSVQDVHEKNMAAMGEGIMTVEQLLEEANNLHRDQLKAAEAAAKALENAPHLAIIDG